jgi:hypothetical protein
MGPEIVPLHPVTKPRSKKHGSFQRNIRIIDRLLGQPGEPFYPFCLATDPNHLINLSGLLLVWFAAGYGAESTALAWAAGQSRAELNITSRSHVLHNILEHEQIISKEINVANEQVCRPAHTHEKMFYLPSFYIHIPKIYQNIATPGVLEANCQVPKNEAKPRTRFPCCPGPVQETSTRFWYPKSSNLSKAFMSWRKARRDRRAGQADVRLGAQTNQQKDTTTSSCV